MILKFNCYFRFCRQQDFLNVRLGLRGWSAGGAGSLWGVGGVLFIEDSTCVDQLVCGVNKFHFKPTSKVAVSH